MELKAIQSLSATILLASMVVSLTACESMTTRQRNTTIGVGIGSVAGAALGGNMLSTLGGAAAGGLIGNQVKK